MRDKSRVEEGREAGVTQIAAIIPQGLVGIYVVFIVCYIYCILLHQDRVRALLEGRLQASAALHSCMQCMCSIA
jgi:hypothetical protein